ncbi:PhzF family phenazine biosynthesis isomerase [Arthrobacter zhaoguopingii]|uniref:PhzF family phenazine biosynthesis isomerase n=1 Tax=Arthrobacter zhaoguopingii TaxID=2681491 RepID=UPI00135A8B80|nr:PhzF family phenazine biosynthesis isomerase [Arthrobacter zhaoguopingii]
MEILRYAAFTSDPAGGNPAGVVLDATGLDESRMQRIAADLGYSETAFVWPGDGRNYTLRYFSPLAEVPFCGHATIATGVALAERIGPGDLMFGTPVGDIAVSTAGTASGHRATLVSAPTRSRAASAAETAGALAALGWAPDDLDPALPAQVAFAGNEHLVLAARSRERLADLHYDFDGLGRLMTERGWTTLQLIWRENPVTFHSRNPFPVGGVVEDPATGAAAAALGGYLRELGLITAPQRITILQGQDMGRPSTLEIDVSPTDARVSVSGSAVPIPE